MRDDARRKTTLLVMGFRRSGEPAIDPSGEILSRLGATTGGGSLLRTLLLPPGPDDALLKAIETMDFFLPDVVLVLGLADGHASLSVERVAVNLFVSGDGLSADAGQHGDPIDAAGPAGYFSPLPVEAMVGRMRSAGIPARSAAAGAHGQCNRLHYALLHYVALRGRETWFKRCPPSGLFSRVGCIQFPPTPEMITLSGSEAPSLPLETSLKGILLAIEAIVEFLQTAGEGSALPRPAVDS